MKSSLPYCGVPGAAYGRRGVRALLCLFIVALLLVASSAGVSAEPPMKIGVVTALTGDAASYGQDIKNGVEFANERLLGGRYQLVFEDDRCEPRAATSAVQKLISTDKVRYILGFACSGPLLSVAPILTREKIVTFTSGATAAKISQASDYIYRTLPGDGQAVKILFEHMRTRHRHIGVVVEETEFCQGLAQDFTSRATAAGIPIETRNFLTSDRDLRGTLLNLLRTGVDALYVSVQTENSLYQVVRQLHDLHISVPLYNTYLGASTTFLKLAGPLAEGLVVADLPPRERWLSEEGKELYSEYVAKYGPPKSWDLLWAATVESLRALDQAIRSGGDVGEFLTSHEFAGVLGKYRFDANGDIEGVSQILTRIENGKAVPLDPSVAP